MSRLPFAFAILALALLLVSTTVVDSAQAQTPNHVEATLMGSARFPGASGLVTFDFNGTQGTFFFQVTGVNLPAGTVLNVMVDGIRVGAVRLGPDGTGQDEVSTARASTLGAVQFGSKVELWTQPPDFGPFPTQVVLSGTFQ